MQGLLRKNKKLTPKQAGCVPERPAEDRRDPESCKEKPF